MSPRIRDGRRPRSPGSARRPTSASPHRKTRLEAEIEEHAAVIERASSASRPASRRSRPRWPRSSSACSPRRIRPASPRWPRACPSRRRSTTPSPSATRPAHDPAVEAPDRRAGGRGRRRAGRRGRGRRRADHRRGPAVARARGRRLPTRLRPRPSTSPSPRRRLPSRAEAAEAEAAGPRRPTSFSIGRGCHRRRRRPAPRALGLTPDFAAAEAEAAAFAERRRPPTRRSPRSPTTPSPPASPASCRTRRGRRRRRRHDPVVVTGLVSVASIAGFKRHLGRVPGVQSVGVSSGPDGEFVFAVTHGADVVLRDAIPTLPGFGARVTGDGRRRAAPSTAPRPREPRS